MAGSPCNVLGLDSGKKSPFHLKPGDIAPIFAKLRTDQIYIPIPEFFRIPFGFDLIHRHLPASLISTTLNSRL
jgi:hypothetical protein